LEPIITSTKNEWVRRAQQLAQTKGRNETGCLLVSGHKLMEEALRCGLKAQWALCSPEWLEKYTALADLFVKKGGCIIRAQDRVVAAASGQGGEEGAAAVFVQPQNVPALRKGGLYVALDCIQDPGNMGTILRVADALKLDGCLLGTGCADPYSLKALRGAMGAAFRLKMYRGPLEAQLRSAVDMGIPVMAADMNGTDFFHRQEDVKGGILLVGSEGQGLSQTVRELATVTYKLPMPGEAESLNAAVAAGIMLYDLWRRG